MSAASASADWYRAAGSVLQGRRDDGLEVTLDRPRQLSRRRAASFRNGADLAPVAAVRDESDGLGQVAGTDPIGHARKRLFVPERAAAAEKLEQHDTQGVHVGRDGHLAAQQLFRAGVGRCRRWKGPMGQVAGVITRRRLQLRDPEVEELGLPISGDENVGRLEVPVNHEVLVRVLHRGADSAEQPQALRNRQRLSIAVLGDRSAIDVLHDEERSAIRQRARIQQSRDVRVLERGEDLLFQLEPLQRGLAGDFVPQHLDRDGLARRLAFRQVDLAHSAHADAPDDLKPPDGASAPDGGAVRLQAFHGLGRVFGRRRFDAGDQRTDSLGELRLFGVELAQESCALGGWQSQCLVQVVLDDPEGIFHRGVVGALHRTPPAMAMTTGSARGTADEAPRPCAGRSTTRALVSRSAASFGNRSRARACCRPRGTPRGSSAARDWCRRGHHVHRATGTGARRSGRAPPQASLNGSRRRRFPVSANTALPTAGAIGGTPGSPMPPGFSALDTMNASTRGISDSRRTG